MTTETTAEECVLAAVAAELARARAKFPRPLYTTAAATEEVGELARAVLHRVDPPEASHHGASLAAIATEAVQAIAMHIRLIEDGDESLELPPTHLLAAADEWGPAAWLEAVALDRGAHPSARGLLADVASWHGTAARNARIFNRWTHQHADVGTALRIAAVGTIVVTVRLLTEGDPALALEPVVTADRVPVPRSADDAPEPARAEQNRRLHVETVRWTMENRGVLEAVALELTPEMAAYARGRFPGVVAGLEPATWGALLEIIMRRAAPESTVDLEGAVRARFAAYNLRCRVESA